MNNLVDQYCRARDSYNDCYRAVQRNDNWGTLLGLGDYAVEMDLIEKLLLDNLWLGLS